MHGCLDAWIGVWKDEMRRLHRSNVAQTELIATLAQLDTARQAGTVRDHKACRLPCTLQDLHCRAFAVCNKGSLSPAQT